jgi:hypothetical protein
MTIVSPRNGHSLGNVSDLGSPSYRNLEANNESNRDCDRWVSEISVDRHGSVCYHNPTSSFHEAPLNNSRSNSELELSHERLEADERSSIQHTDEIKLSLVSNAAAQRRFEAMAVEKIAAVQSEVSSEVASELLKFHWCWIHPMFQFVYRPAFTSESAKILTLNILLDVAQEA